MVLVDEPATEDGKILGDRFKGYMAATRTAERAVSER